MATIRQTEESTSKISKKLSFDYLSKITNDFSDDRKLGVSQFGTLYKGIMEDGNFIAVKRLDHNATFQPDIRFQNEIDKIMEHKHENLVEAVGFCSEQRQILMPSTDPEKEGTYDNAEVTERLLCYKYFPNGNLDDYLFGKKAARDFSCVEQGTSKAAKDLSSVEHGSSEAATYFSSVEQGTSKATQDLSSADPGTSKGTKDLSSPKTGSSIETEDLCSARAIIDWDTRFEIINGICHGLRFLHTRDSPIIHMDLKLGNIWLGEEMVPKIGNFGLSRLLGADLTAARTQNIVGSYGHMAPEYKYRGEISTKADIYSLGLLIIEITTREKNCPIDNEPSARQYITKIRTDWTAERIASKYSSLDAERLHQIHSCIKTGLECVEVDRRNRPPIEKIIDKLNAG